MYFTEYLHNLSLAPNVSALAFRVDCERITVRRDKRWRG
jgi:hypothetical protein